ncbi:DUF1643 domain-containing protein [Clostridioides difficile]|nr:DUF1643 domain-containing protein [Clostridioides difficile]NJK13223.1 DUF1643 domain-containing protein [Clostridioides difficile]
MDRINYEISIYMEKYNEKKFRYNYRKKWDENKKIIAILFNPSKATLTQNDKTTDFLTEFFMSKGYGELIIINLFAFMCSKSEKISDTEEQFEYKNWEYVLKYLDSNLKNDSEKDFFIGWGANISSIKDDKAKEIIKNKKKKIRSLLKNSNFRDNVYCFKSKNNKELHPSKYRFEWQYIKRF